VDEFIGAQAENVSVHGCHPLDSPIRRVVADGLIDLDEIPLHLLHEFPGETSRALGRFEIGRHGVENRGRGRTPGLFSGLPIRLAAGRTRDHRIAGRRVPAAEIDGVQNLKSHFSSPTAGRNWIRFLH